MRAPSLERRHGERRGARHRDAPTGAQVRRSALSVGRHWSSEDRWSIPIPEWLRDELVDLLAARAEKRGTPTQFDEYLFQTRYGNPINRDKLRQNVIRPALVRAGLPESIRTYDLRHTHASLLIHLNANVLEVAQRMGHTDAAVTLRQYGHLFEGTQAALTEKLEAERVRTESPTPDHGHDAAVIDMASRRVRAQG